jgi:hypothetical protein
MVVAELLSNAFLHAPGPAWVRAAWEGERPRLEVHDLGPGFVLDPRLPEPDSERGRGLFIVNAIADDLARAGKTAGGSAVSATLPVRRRVERSHDRPRHTVAALPSPEEARPDGTFGKEAFLRALVVEMAQTIEADQGPDVAAATVAQVGADIGGRMEEAYRTATASPAGCRPSRSPTSTSASRAPSAATSTSSTPTSARSCSVTGVARSEPSSSGSRRCAA